MLEIVVCIQTADLLEKVSQSKVLILDEFTSR
jgi:hypothetical protein